MIVKQEGLNVLPLTDSLYLSLQDFLRLLESLSRNELGIAWLTAITALLLLMVMVIKAEVTEGHIGAPGGEAGVAAAEAVVGRARTIAAGRAVRETREVVMACRDEETEV
jgi:hypothetical protein